MPPTCIRPLAFCCVLAWAFPAGAAVLLNEVHYDPAGADGGREFVEIINTGPEAVALAGLALDFANGAVGPVWAERWAAGAGDSLAAGALWLVADRGWTGPADAVAALGLQNGPDAVRLRRGDAVLDRLGYGALTDPALFEGAPHPGAVGGGSLARRPDGHDTDRNAADWAAAEEPTPGAVNVRRRSLRLVSSRVEPPCQLRPARPYSVVVRLENDGLEAWEGGWTALLDGEGPELIVAAAPPLAAGAQGEWRGAWTPADTGLVRPVLQTVVDGSPWPLPLPPVWTGVAAATLREVMPAPAAGAPEWVEVAGEGELPVSLAGWALEDAGGAPRELPPADLLPGARLVLCADRDAFRIWLDGRLAAGAPPPCGVDAGAHAEVLSGGWPVLNNTAAADAPYADRLVLRRPDGVAVDQVAWGGRRLMPPAGRSLERVAVPPRGDPDRDWAVCTAALGSTPGCPEAVAAAVDPRGPGLAATPERIPPGGGTTLGFTLLDGERSWDLRVLGLDGGSVRRLGGDALGPGPRHAVWDGTDDGGRRLPPGPRLVVLRVRDDGGRLQRRAVAVVVLDRSAP